MKKTSILGIGLTLVIMLTITSLGMARGGGKHWDSGHRNQLATKDCPVLSTLTPEQQEEFIEFNQTHKEWMYPKNQQFIARKAELNALLATEGTSSAEIEKIKKEISSLNQEIYERKMNHRIEMNQKYNINPGMKGQGRGSKNFAQGNKYSRQGCPGYSR